MKARRLTNTAAGSVFSITAAFGAAHAQSPNYTPASWTTAIIAGKSDHDAKALIPPMPASRMDLLDTSKPAIGPYGYFSMCKTAAYGRLCENDAREAPNPQPRKLTETDWINMHRVIHEMTLNFKIANDHDLYKGQIEKWALSWKGDCEDFALLFKHLMKTRHGWQDHELLMAVVGDEKGEGHAVMVARTDRGYLTADIKANGVNIPYFKQLDETGYTLSSLQTPTNRQRWADISKHKFLSIVVPPLTLVTQWTGTIKRASRGRPPIALRDTLR